MTSIVADLTLLVAPRDQVPELAIHASSVASCRNSAAVSLYRDLGVRWVILTRDVTLNQIDAITRGAPDVEIEVFILNDGCVYEEGVCHSIHLPKKLGGPIGVASHQFEYVGVTGKVLPHKAVCRLQDNDADYKRWLWCRFGCGFSTTDEGSPMVPAACAPFTGCARLGWPPSARRWRTAKVGTCATTRKYV